MTGGYFVRTYELWRGTQTQNDYGELVTVWQKRADVPGRAYLGRMNDAFRAAQEVGIVQWTFATLADTDIKIGDEVRFGDHRLRVQAVSVTSRGDRIEALCQEVQT